MRTMSITKDEELEHVSTAYFLEDALMKLDEKRRRLEGNRPSKPAPPRKPVLTIPEAPKEGYPQVIARKSSFPKVWRTAAVFFGVMCFASIPLRIIFISTASLFPLYAPFTSLASSFPILFVLCVILGLIVKVISAKKAREEVERTRNSDEYKKKCAAIDERNLRRQEKAAQEAEQRYQTAMDDFENTLVPKYREELAMYEAETLPAWKTEVAAIHDAINETKATLQEVYDQNTLPGRYRNPDALAFIASFMGTSNYDLKFAIERYDKELDRIIEQEQLDTDRAVAEMTAQILDEQQYANYLEEQRLDYLAEGNRLLRHTRNWAAAGTALQAIDIVADWRRAKAAKR